MRGACESKQDWVNIFDGLRSRGLEELLFVSMDGVTGVADGLKVIYPNARTFRCIVHMIRNSCRHIGYKERKEWCADIKPLYSSPDLTSAEAALRALENKWKASNPAAVKFWVRNFDEFVAPLYSVTSSIRKVIYTTNAVESLNSCLRTVVQKGAYSSEKAILTSMLLRCEKGLASNWRRRAIPNWTKIREELMAIEEYEELCIRDNFPPPISKQNLHSILDTLMHAFVLPIYPYAGNVVVSSTTAYSITSSTRFFRFDFL